MARPKETIQKRLSKFDLTLDKLSMLYKDGWTDLQVADFVGVAVRTIHEWKKLNEFVAPLKNWKELADSKVEKRLYKRAIGYKYDEITYEQTKTGGLGIKMSGEEVSELKHVPTTKTKIVTKQVAPDVIAQIFWLKNRKPNEWRDKHDIVIEDYRYEENKGLSVYDLLKEADEIANRIVERRTTPSNN